ncbi:MAG: ABC transporter ATP-binding protein [Thermoanaerobacteraceae bacterium]|nr:ABC transporter ATP-binding protein [Thermoanaerobacteraceae bacterium]
MTNLLSVSNVTKIYETGKRKVVGVKDISFCVKQGEFVSVIGPSGCGKSTLLRCIAGFEKTNKGNICLDGQKVKRPEPNRFMVFQGLDQLFPWLTLKENIVFAMKVVDKKQGNLEKKAEHYLELVGLEGFGDFYPYQLSGGMKQRASIARALSVRPKLLLMDEPFGSLDAFTRRAIHQMFLNVWQKTGVTVIFVTHDMEEAIDLSDKIIVFSKGRLKDLIENPLSRPRERDVAAYRSFLLKISDLLGEERTGSSDSKELSAAEAKLAF